MLKNKRFLTGILMVLNFCFFFPSHCLAGKLDDFEEEATQKKKSPKKEKKPPSPEKPKRDTETVIFRATSGCNSFSDCLFSFFFDLMVAGLYEGGKSSLNQTLHNESIAGTPILPIVSIDSHYQNIESDVYSINNRLEVGFGPFGFQYKESRYIEKDPNDQLKMYQLNYLHRMSDGEFFRMDIGLWTLTLDGNNSNTGFSLTSPVYFFLPKRFSFYLRPNWGWINSNTVQEYDVGLLFSREYVSLQGGYRFVQSGQQTLNGPFLGINFHY